MTFKHQLLKIFYKVWMMISRTTGIGKTTTNNNSMTKPAQPFYSLQAVLNNGKPLAFESLKGKYVMLANTASNCGYTGQYDDLEKLHHQYKDKLVVLGFPANNFGAQEPGSNADIQTFCEKNYGVSFPMAAKVSVKGEDMAPIYKWLTTKSANGVLDAEIGWNFNKFLLDEKGHMLAHFPSKVKPMDEAIISKL